MRFSEEEGDRCVKIDEKNRDILIEVGTQNEGRRLDCVGKPSERIA